MNGADYIMICTQTDIEGLHAGEKLYIKAWAASGELIAVVLTGEAAARVIHKEAFNRLALGDMKFFGTVVAAGRSLINE